MTSQHIIKLHDSGLINWEEMQVLLRKNGCEMKQIDATGQHRLLPLKSIYN